MMILTNAVSTFNHLCVQDIKANVSQCSEWLDKSVGIVTTLLPHIGYEKSSLLAKEAYQSGLPIREIITRKGFLTKESMEIILSTEEVTTPGIAGEHLLKKYA